MTTQFTNGYALLIGVNENQVPKWALPGVAQDVSELAKVLLHPERCAYPEANVEIVLDKNATRQNILDALQRLDDKIRSDQTGDTTAIVYYSGHGFVDKDSSPEQYFLIPYDVTEQSLKARALRAEDFGGTIQGLTPQRLLVVLDCCHAAGMDIKSLSGMSDSAIPTQLFMPVKKSVSVADGSKALASLAQGAGRAVLNSSKGTQYSYVRKDRSMSIFSFHFIEALTGHAQPQDGATEVLVSDVMSYVHRHVPLSAKESWHGEQEPQYQVSGNFAIALLLGGKGITKGTIAPSPLDPLPPVTVMNTGSGVAVAGGDISGDVVGGDKITVGNIHGQGIVVGRNAQATVHINNGITADELDALFVPLLRLAGNASVAQREEAIQTAESLKDEVAKGKKADDSTMGKLLDRLLSLMPKAVGTVIQTFASPFLSGLAGPVTQFVLDKLKNK